MAKWDVAQIHDANIWGGWEEWDGEMRRLVSLLALRSGWVPCKRLNEGLVGGTGWQQGGLTGVQRCAQQGLTSHRSDAVEMGI